MTKSAALYSSKCFGGGLPKKLFVLCRKVSRVGVVVVCSDLGQRNIWIFHTQDTIAYAVEPDILLILFGGEPQIVFETMLYRPLAGMEIFYHIRNRIGSIDILLQQNPSVTNIPGKVAYLFGAKQKIGKKFFEYLCLQCCVRLFGSTLFRPFSNYPYLLFEKMSVSSTMNMRS